MRIKEHPILEFNPDRKVKFTLDRIEMESKEGVPLTSDLVAAGIKVLNGDIFIKLLPGRIIVATGASENMLTFVNNNLPGVFGRGGSVNLLGAYIQRKDIKVFSEAKNRVFNLFPLLKPRSNQLAGIPG